MFGYTAPARERKLVCRAAKGRLPETVPKKKKIPEDGATMLQTAKFIPDASADRQNSKLSHPSLWPAASFAFFSCMHSIYAVAYVPVMSVGPLPSQQRVCVCV